MSRVMDGDVKVMLGPEHYKLLRQASEEMKAMVDVTLETEKGSVSMTSENARRALRTVKEIQHDAEFRGIVEEFLHEVNPKTGEIPPRQLEHPLLANVARAERLYLVRETVVRERQVVAHDLEDAARVFEEEEGDAVADRHPDQSLVKRTLAVTDKGLPS